MGGYLEIKKVKFLFSFWYLNFVFFKSHFFLKSGFKKTYFRDNSIKKKSSYFFFLIVTSMLNKNFGVSRRKLTSTDCSSVSKKFTRFELKSARARLASIFTNKKLIKLNFSTKGIGLSFIKKKKKKKKKSTCVDTTA